MSRKNQNAGSVEFVRNPELKQIEARFSRYERSIFKKHTHEDYSIAVVVQGTSNFFYQNSVEKIRAGEIALVNPGEVHACNADEGDVWAYRMFYVDCGLIRTIADDVFGAEGGLPRFTQQIVRDRQLFDALLGLYELLLDTDNTLERDSCIHETLAELLIGYGDRRSCTAMPEQAAKPLQRAHDYLIDKLSENISLEELSCVAGFSAYHLLRMFREHFGLPPHAFQRQQRIHRGKQMLAEGRTIVDVALDLGFSDQSHFSNTFKSLVGATPRQYQKARS